MAIIKVGAATETEMKEKKARVEDAMHATKAAVEEGIVAGRRRGAAAGVASVLQTLKLEGDEQIGVNDHHPRDRGAACAGSRPTPATRARSSCSA